MIVHTQHVFPFTATVDETDENKLIRCDRAKNTATERDISTQWRDYKFSLITCRSKAPAKLQKIRTLIGDVLASCADNELLEKKAQKWHWISERINACVVGNTEASYDLRY